MKIITPNRAALSICATAAWLAACGGSQWPIAAPGVMPPGPTAAVRPKGPICGVHVIHAFFGGPHGYYLKGWGPDGLTLVNGKLYGTTDYGGRADRGVVYTLTPSGRFHVLYSFKGGRDGYNPSGLTLYKGNFYGLTGRGGASGNGAFYQITPTGQEKVLYSFRGGRDGEFPEGMTLYKGNFYGTTIYGGLGAGWGTAFEVSPTGQERILHRFGARKDDYAGSPGSELFVLNGVLYGTAGTSKDGWGTIFSLTTSGHYENIHTFTNAEGGAVVAMRAYRGTLYGTTKGGYMGIPLKFVRGAFFEMRPAHPFHVIVHLGGIDNPPGGLVPIDGGFYLHIDEGPFKNGGIHKLTLSGDLSLVCWFRLRPPPPKGVGTDVSVGLHYEGGSLYGISKWGGERRAGGGTILEVTP
jgi:uncharacterized repeat protein (TIGR03803 family)